MPFENLKNSAISASIAEFITLPISVIKTNYQNSKNINEKIYQTIKIIKINHGIKGFYLSSPFSILSQILNISFKYTFYKNLEKYDKSSVRNGIISGIIISFFTHPIDNIKINLQMNKIKISNLYQGYSKSLIKSSLSGIIFFPLVVHMNKRDEEKKFSNSLFVSLLTNLILHPIDLLKNQHIYNGIEYPKLYKIFLKGKIDSLDKREIRNNLNRKIISFYYRGISLTFLKTFFHFSILFGILEYLNSFEKKLY